MKENTHSQNWRGFTIVELLVVIVVIGILAAITVVAFNGVSQQAGTASLQSDLRSTANKLAVYAVTNNDRFPSSLGDAGVQDSASATYVYTYTSPTNEFCVTAYASQNGVPAHFVNEQSAGVPVAGECPGHSNPADVLVATWTQRTSLGTGSWRALAISGDGQSIVVAPSSGVMRLSIDGGVTWSQLNGAGSRFWTGVAISDDGQTIVGVASTLTPVISTDGGTSWLTPAAAGNRNWQAVTISADGSSIAAAATGTGGNYVHTSQDYGVTWTQRTSVGQSGWQSIDSSSSGQYIVVVSGGGGFVRHSSDYGATWSSAPYASQSWWGTAVSDDGQRLVAGPSSPTGKLRQSLDGGSTWRTLEGTPIAEWRGVDSSRDGAVILGINRADGQIVYSTDAGETWTYEPIITASIRFGACSADCRTMVVTDFTSGYLYTGILAPES